MNILEKILEEIKEVEKKFVVGNEVLFALGATGLAGEIAEIICSHMDEAKDTNVPSNDGWIPVEERLPEDDRYILLSFENFSLPLVGRYEENEKGGAFYIGDCDEEDTCASNDLFVNAWQPLPEPYRSKVKTKES